MVRAEYATRPSPTPYSPADQGIMCHNLVCDPGKSGSPGQKSGRGPLIFCHLPLPTKLKPIFFGFPNPKVCVGGGGGGGKEIQGVMWVGGDVS